MDVSQALELVDRLLYEAQGKRLNDLERQVFIGSWQGRTYEEIYPDNPEYVEKSVGYKLWQKLTKLSGDKVSKKTLHGFLARLVQQQADTLRQQPALLLDTNTYPDFRRILISHRASGPDSGLAHILQQALVAAGHQVTLTIPTAEPEPPPADWLPQLATELRRCDYFILLLSPTAVVSEMVLEELQQAHRHRRSHPIIIPIRIQCPLEIPINADLWVYLSRLSQFCWDSDADTSGLIQAVMTQIDRPEMTSSSSVTYEPIGAGPLPATSWPPAPTADPELPQAVDDYWSDTFGSKDNCTAYFEDCVLSSLETPLVLALDEVDRIFQHPMIADDFFGLLRAWYEEAGYSDSGSGLWEKLRLVIVHSTEVYIPLDVNQSPFNVGLPIELTEFSCDQVTELADRHRLTWNQANSKALMQFVGGHPYLIRLALYHLAQRTLSLSDLLATAATESGIYADHLRRHLWNLQQHPPLAVALSHVVQAREPIELDSILAFKLHSLGLVQMQGNLVVSRFELYHQYFQNRLS